MPKQVKLGRPKGTKNRTYTPEFKVEVVKYYQENGTAETERYYGVVHTVFQNWERIYLEKGIEGLSKENRGRKKNSKTSIP